MNNVLDDRSAELTEVDDDGRFLAVVRGRELVTDGVVLLSLGAADGGRLPAWEPGAHIDLHLADGDGSQLGGNPIRQYSLCGNPADHDSYEIAVLEEVGGRGGSCWIHRELEIGALLRVSAPRNNFDLVDADEYLFVAGGIGITPILPMIRSVAARGKSWRLVYGGRTRRSMAFADYLQSFGGPAVELNPQDETGLLDLSRILGSATSGTAVYCCGPEPLLTALEKSCVGRPVPLYLERFAPKNQPSGAVDTAFEVELAQSGRLIQVDERTSLLEALDDAGVDIDFSCQEGTCGTCETSVLEGIPDHRDSLLSADERAANEVMFPCVSRCLSSRLVLDL
jgi:ferredoxin-NADP reductase